MLLTVPGRENVDEEGAFSPKMMLDTLQHELTDEEQILL